MKNNIKWGIYLLATDALIIANYIGSDFTYPPIQQAVYVSLLIFFLLSIITMVAINFIESRIQNAVYVHLLCIALMLASLVVKELTLIFLVTIVTI